MERELTQENERRESDASYRRHRENFRREKELNDQLVGNESCWSLEPLRMELHAIEEAELRRLQRLKPRQPTDLIDLTEEDQSEAQRRKRAFGPAPTSGSSKIAKQIPAMTAQKVKIAVFNTAFGLKTVRANPEVLNSNLTIPPGIVDIQEPYVEIIVQNNTEKDETFNPNEHIVIFEEVEGDLVEINVPEASPAVINCFTCGR